MDGVRLCPPALSHTLLTLDALCVTGVPVESIRLRFALLQSLNHTLHTFFLPLVDLRPVATSSLSCSTGALLAHASGLIFYDTKLALLNRVVNMTAFRKPDQVAPEICLDPLEMITGKRSVVDSSN